MRAHLALLALLLSACATPGVSSSPTPTPSPPPVVELKYRVFDQVGRPWYCDSDFFPIARADEKDLARQRLPEMQRDPDTYAAILRHNGLSAGTTLADDQLLAVYHDWKDLRALELKPTGVQDAYGTFQLFRPANASKQGERVDLRVSAAGKITVIHREPAGPPNCPICLGETALIDTPRGPIRVTELHVGDLVWTADAGGSRVTAPIVAVGGMEAPLGHELVRVTLADGRAATASPGHPLAAGRPLGSIAVGERVDGSIATAIARLPYLGRTYDLLPAGATGTYWADGVLLRSTLHR